MAGTLSLSELAELTRFGIHDDDVLGDIVIHIDDEVQCGAKDTVAVAIARLRCCGSSTPICQGHIDSAKVLLRDRVGVCCDRCSHDLTGRPFDEVVELMPL